MSEKMMKAEMSALIEHFKKIMDLTKTPMLGPSLEMLIDEFNLSIVETNEVSRKLGSLFNMPLISKPQDYFFQDMERVKVEIQAKGSKALAFLIMAIMPALSKDQVDKLRSLREELEKIVEPNCQKNLLKAIEEYEQAHHLASALIASRVVVNNLEKIPGKNDEEKVSYLFQKGLIAEKREDAKSSILRACRLARNILSHRIDIFPEPDEALSLLANSVTLSKVTSKVNE